MILAEFIGVRFIIILTNSLFFFYYALKVGLNYNIAL
jgi:hypothetical protein